MHSSRELFERGSRVMPGGVNSPARAFGAVGGIPPFFAAADGNTITDVDGRSYIDYVGSWGPFILGHQHPSVLDAITAQLERATSFGAPTEVEVELAELLVEQIDGLDMVRLVCSGTEATMSAIRLARGATGRDRIVKFAGCYHGHGDSFLIEAGSGALTHGVPSSPGVTDATASDTLTARFNDVTDIERIFAEEGEMIAGVILEPIAGNMGVVPADPDFLTRLRTLCTVHGALLIFDEVMTGFRIGFGGAAARYGILPDLFTYGKIIGGGLPVGAYGGRRDIMEMVSPVGPVYQAGTLSGNPLAVSAGLATLRTLLDLDPYDDLESAGAALEMGLAASIERHSVPATINRVGSMITLFFTDRTVTSFDDAKSSDTRRFTRFFHAMLEARFYLPPSQFEAWFLSICHDRDDIDRTLEAADRALAAMTEPVQ